MSFKTSWDTLGISSTPLLRHPCKLRRYVLHRPVALNPAAAWAEQLRVFQSESENSSSHWRPSVSGAPTLAQWVMIRLSVRPPSRVSPWDLTSIKDLGSSGGLGPTRSRGRKREVHSAVADAVFHQIG